MTNNEMNLKCDLESARSHIANLEHTIRKQQEEIEHWKAIASKKTIPNSLHQSYHYSEHGQNNQS